MQENIVIGGEISLITQLDGDGNVALSCDGEEGTIIQYDSHSAYSGSYEITPSSEMQIIPIENQIALQNITIQPIPHNYGLIGWNGAFLTIS